MTKMKPVLIIGLFMISVMSAPISDFVQAKPGNSYEDQVDTMDEAQALSGALGDIFGMFREYGASGDTFSMVFEMLFDNFENMSATQEMKGVYVLNASIISDQESGTYEYGEGSQQVYYPWGVYDLANATDEDDRDEYPYFVLNESGTVEYNKTEGASITFIIWDEDGSFIKALDNLIDATKTLKEIAEKSESGQIEDEQAMSEAISAVLKAVTYFLIHINDIITGDEVIIFNVIGFTSYQASFDGTVSGEWFITQNYQQTNTRTLDAAYPNWETEYRTLANQYNDDYMLYFLNQEYINKETQNYTSFSFDIIELWLKEFQVSIDVEAILSAITGEAGENYFGNKTATEIFQELKLEFYIFTHHFQNYYLFDDAKFDDPKYSDAVQAKANNGVPDVIFEEVGTYENETVERISDSEIQDYLQIRGAEQWEFLEPEYDAANRKMDWGVRANNVGFRVLPVGMTDDQVNETEAPIEQMEFIELGFTFQPNKREKVGTEGYDYINAKGETTMGSAKVKLLQSFGKWTRDTDGKPFTPHLKTDQLQLASVFMSTIFHFKLWIENKKIAEGSEIPDQALLDENNYNRSSQSVKVGNVENSLPLAEIDIAGPDYSQTGADDIEHTYPAKTTTIPTIYAEWEGQSSETYTQEDNSTARINSTVNFDFSVLVYAVAYDTFDSSGDEIIHDPTFSIFIVSENPGVLAVILVVGSVTLMGIAAVIITKRKNASLGF